MLPAGTPNGVMTADLNIALPPDDTDPLTTVNPPREYETSILCQCPLTIAVVFLGRKLDYAGLFSNMTTWPIPGKERKTA